MIPEFAVNQTVVHKREGLATIFADSIISGKQYYLLRALRGDGETIYVPGDSCDNIIRPVMSIPEAEELLKYMSTVEKEYTTNTKQRRDFYKKLLNSGDIKDLSFLAIQLRIYNLIDHDAENTEMKLGVMDIDMLSKASNILMDELALTYSVPREEIESYIYNKINR